MITDELTKEYLGTNIGAHLTEIGWTQERLAYEAGETPMTISRIVRKIHVPNAAILARIAEALGVSVDFLLREPPKGPAKKSSRNLSRAIDDK